MHAQNKIGILSHVDRQSPIHKHCTMTLLPVHALVGKRPAAIPNYSFLSKLYPAKFPISVIVCLVVDLFTLTPIAPQHCTSIQPMSILCTFFFYSLDDSVYGIYLIMLYSDLYFCTAQKSFTWWWNTGIDGEEGGAHSYPDSLSTLWPSLPSIQHESPPTAFRNQLHLRDCKFAGKQILPQY